MNTQRSEQAWEKLTLEVDQDQSALLAALLGEILPGGVVEEKNYGDLFPSELDQYQGPVLLCGYYPAESREEVRGEVSRLLEEYGAPDLFGRVEFSTLQNRNWATAWQERYRPIPVGQSLVIVPTWLENPYPERNPVWMDPGMAFGSGTHPTTQLCLRLLERSLLDCRVSRMIDVGCGSGILSIGAAILGVRDVLGVDNDPDVVQIAANNAEENGVSQAVSFRAGSVNEILVQGGRFSSAPLVAANIIAPILVDLFGQGLGRLVGPGGRIVLSGILTEQLPAILSCLDGDGFTLVEQQNQGEWVGLIAQR